MAITKTELLLRLTLPAAAAAVLSVAIPSHQAVRKGAQVRELKTDGEELSAAMKNLFAHTDLRNGASVSYSDLEAWLPVTSDLKARGGKDCFGNLWGPFVLGQPLRPSASTVSRCVPLVDPSEWDRLR